MAYANLLSVFGHRWISADGIRHITETFPDKMYDVDVYLVDGSQKPLAKCTGLERNIEKIEISYIDGTGKVDPDPYIQHIYGPVDGKEFVTGTFDRNPRLHFFERCKDEFHTQTRNEDPRNIAMFREAARKRFVTFVGMDGVDSGKKDGTLHIPLNIFNKAGRRNLIKFLENLDSDGIMVSVEVEFDRSTIDQLQRMDTEMELIRVEDEVEKSMEPEEC